MCKDHTVQLDVLGAGDITYFDLDDGSSDACEIASRVVSKDTFACKNVGDNDVTLTITDMNTNTDTCIGTVTVEDNVVCIRWTCNM